jgi:SAM-dependent methyltransferase
MNPRAYREMAEIEATHWWFRGRRAILARIIEGLGLPPDSSILELGAGTGGNLAMLSAFGRVRAMEMDAAARAIAAARLPGIDVRGGSLPSEIPFAGEKFDLVCLFDVLEHVDRDIDALLAIRELLTDGGCLLITVPAYQWLWTGHDDLLQHKRRYTAAMLRERVRASGYQEVRMTYFNSLLFPASLLARFVDRWRKSESPIGVKVPAAPINGLLARIFGCERLLLPRLRLPFGVSLLCVLRKPSLLVGS